MVKAESIEQGEIKNSGTGNRTPSYRVQTEVLRGGNVSRYTIPDSLIDGTTTIRRCAHMSRRQKGILWYIWDQKKKTIRIRGVEPRATAYY
jgi:hypothetical protein